MNTVHGVFKKKEFSSLISSSPQMLYIFIPYS